MGRTVAVCTNCGEEREIAAHGLCFKCYRADERDKQLSTETWMKSDKHSKDMRQAQKKTRKALMKMMDALEEIQAASLVPGSTIDEWRRLLQPEVARIAFSLATASEAPASPSGKKREKKKSNHPVRCGRMSSTRL